MQHVANVSLTAFIVDPSEVGIEDIPSHHIGGGGGGGGGGGVGEINSWYLPPDHIK